MSQRNGETLNISSFHDGRMGDRGGGRRRGQREDAECREEAGCLSGKEEKDVACSMDTLLPPPLPLLLFLQTQKTKRSALDLDVDQQNPASFSGKKLQ